MIMHLQSLKIDTLAENSSRHVGLQYMECDFLSDLASFMNKSMRYVVSYYNDKKMGRWGWSKQCVLLCYNLSHIINLDKRDLCNTCFVSQLSQNKYSFKPINLERSWGSQYLHSSWLETNKLLKWSSNFLFKYGIVMCTLQYLVRLTQWLKTQNGK